MAIGTDSFLLVDLITRIRTRVGVWDVYELANINTHSLFLKYGSAAAYRKRRHLIEYTRSLDIGPVDSRATDPRR